MRSNNPNKRWGHYKEAAAHTLTVRQVEDLRDLLQPGDKVKAEILSARHGSDELGAWKVEKVEIRKNYTHMALTDKGPVTWKNIAIHNRHLTEGGAEVIWMI